MIGNDIVDILETKKTSNWERPRFLEKLFTFHEQQLIQNSNNAFTMVWRLWSMKEAAYKLYIQLYPSRFYNPKQFQCSINGLHGKVRYKDFKCILKSKITTQYIISEARLSGTEMISRCIRIEDSSAKSHSKILKTLLLSDVSKRFNILEKDLKIVKSKFGVPSIHNNSKKLNLSVTISHHGNYGTFAVL